VATSRGGEQRIASLDTDVARRLTVKDARVGCLPDKPKGPLDVGYVAFHVAARILDLEPEIGAAARFEREEPVHRLVPACALEVGDEVPQLVRGEAGGQLPGRVVRHRR
jgi:hypothetical protein